MTVDFSYGGLYSLALSDYAPAFFESSSGEVAALDLNNNAIGSANPARGGQTIQLFANGLGPLTNQPDSGEPAPFSPLAETTSWPVVTIGGIQAEASFSGLTPGYAGLYQVNAVVPPEVSPGTHPIVISAAKPAI